MMSYLAARMPRATHLCNSPWLCILALPAVAHLLLLARIMVSRVGYPMDLEWMEGGVLYQADRLLEGLPIYVRPGLGYVPFPYPIAYQGLLAGLGAVVGVDYALGRLLSIAFTLAAAFVLARQVFRVHAGGGAPLPMALLALGTIAAGYPVVDAWYDLVRVDMMATALVVFAAAAVAGPLLSRRRAYLAALMLAVSFFTKQSVAPFIAWILLFAVARHRKRALPLLLTTGLAGAAGLALLQLATSGQYWFYTVKLLSNHRVQPARMWEANAVLLRFAPYAPALPALALSLALRRKLSARASLWSGLAVLAWLLGVVSFAKDGGYLNNLIPAVWLLGPVLLLLLADLLALQPEGDLSFILRSSTALVLSALLVWQWYPAEKYTASAGLAARARALNEYVADLDGRVLIPLFPHLAYRNGRGRHQIHVEAHNDFAWAGLPYRETFAKYLKEVDPDYVLISGDEMIADIVTSSYDQLERLPPERYDTVTRIGWRTSPKLLYGRRNAPPR